KKIFTLFIRRSFSAGGLLTIAFTAFALASQAQDYWTQKADFGGTGRHGAVGFSIDGKGYIGTGSIGRLHYVKDFWEYDPLTNAWTQKADFGGSGRWLAVGFSIGSKGYIGTGLASSGTLKKDFWEFDPV